jgi:hypothetical protein
MAWRAGVVSGTGCQIGAKSPLTIPITPIAIIVSPKKSRLAVFQSMKAPLSGFSQGGNRLSRNGRLFAGERSMTRDHD